MNIIINGSGKRKTSVATCFLKQNNENIFYFNGVKMSADKSVVEKLENVIKAIEDNKVKFEAKFYVRGGGIKSQDEALCFALSDGVINWGEKNNIDLKDTKRRLRVLGYIKIDSRKKESKKPGQPKARAKRQFAKR